MARGLAEIPVSAISLDLNRNPYTIEALDGSSEIVDGIYNLSGSFTAVLRSDLLEYIAMVTDNPSVREIPAIASIVLSDDVAGYALTNFAPYSVKISAAVGDFVRVTVGFIAQRASGTSSGGNPSIDNPPALFYNAVVSGIKCTRIEFEVKREVNQNSYFLTSPFIQTLHSGDSYSQLGPTTVQGSISLANSEYSELQDALEVQGSTIPSGIGNDPNLIDISLETTVSTFTISDAHLIGCSLSGSGRNRFEKSITFMGTSITVA